MSTSYDLKCVDCDVYMGWMDRGNGKTHVQSCLRLMNNASKLAVLADMIDELNDHADSYVSSLSVREDYGYNVPLHFFKVHATHKLAVYDEYGGEVGQCNKFVDCLVCDTKKMCALPASHEGPCEVKRR